MVPNLKSYLKINLKRENNIMNRTNFEAIVKTNRKMDDESTSRGRKLNKTKRGGSAKRDWQEV